MKDRIVPINEMDMSIKKVTMNDFKQYRMVKKNAFGQL